MPRVAIPVTEFVRDGVAPPSQTNADASNNHYITGNDERIVVEVVSSDAGSQTVTVVANPAYTADGLTVSNEVCTIPAGATRWIGPWKVFTFKQNATNDVYLNPSVSTNLKFRAYRLPT